MGAGGDVLPDGDHGAVGFALAVAVLPDGLCEVVDHWRLGVLGGHFADGSHEAVGDGVPALVSYLSSEAVLGGGARGPVAGGVRSSWVRVRLAVTEGKAADCSQALPVIEGIEVECLLADKAYDTNEIIDTVREWIW